MVVNDGLNLDTTYTQLINKVSKNIVSKSKVVAIIAEEIRALSKSLYKSVVTRWNSILFMLRSVLKLTDKDFISIKNQLKNKKKLTKKQKETLANFDLSSLERAMLEELKVVLEMFEFVTNELQGNVVSISRVYPCYIYLHTNLLSDTYTTPESGTSKVLFTENIRKDLFKSLETRFKTLIENDIFKLATFLDPFFGLNAFEEKYQSDIKRKVKT